jgi:hypothetical protein
MAQRVRVPLDMNSQIAHVELPQCGEGGSRGRRRVRATEGGGTPTSRRIAPRFPNTSHCRMKRGGSGCCRGLSERRGLLVDNKERHVTSCSQFDRLASSPRQGGEGRSRARANRHDDSPFGVAGRRREKRARPPPATRQLRATGPRQCAPGLERQPTEPVPLPLEG